MALPHVSFKQPHGGPAQLDMEVRAHENPMYGNGVTPLQKSGYADVEKLCQARGLRVHKTRSPQQAFRLLAKCDKQPVMYEVWDWQDLFFVARQRDVVLSRDDYRKVLAAQKAIFVAEASKAHYVQKSKSPVRKQTLKKLTKLAAVAKRSTRPFLIKALEKADREISFNFLGLPPEIRSIVYKHVCVSSATILRAYQPAITRTCLLVRDEALEVFYTQNRFGVRMEELADHFYYMNPLLATISTDHLAAIKFFELINMHRDASFKIDLPCRGRDFQIGVNYYRHEGRYNLDDITTQEQKSTIPALDLLRDGIASLIAREADDIVLGKSMRATTVDPEFTKRAITHVQRTLERLDREFSARIYENEAISDVREKEIKKCLLAQEEWQEMKGFSKDTLYLLCLILEQARMA